MTDNLVVGVTTAAGTVGFGEGVPRDFVTGESLRHSVQTLQSHYLPWLKAKMQTLPTLAELLKEMDEMRGEVAAAPAATSPGRCPR